MTATGESTGFQQRLKVDGLTVEFDVGALDPTPTNASTPAPMTLDDRDAVEAEIARLDEALREANSRLDQGTNKADGLDYAIAITSGILAGVVDSVWVGELSATKARGWGEEQVNKVVMATARRQGYEGDDLAGAVLRLEKDFPFAGDKATNSFGGGTLHHLRDLTHHPSPVGLVASIVMQFTGNAWGVGRSGQLSIVDVASSGLIGTTVPEKLLYGTVKWLLHLVSDVAGSSATAGMGTGLPGPLLSAVHEARASFEKLFRPDERSEFMKRLEGLFRGDSGNVPFDLRTELGLVHQLGRQALPVLLNEALVRGLFFIRRAVAAVNAHRPQTFKQLLAVDLSPALPWQNRTVTRLLTIATSTFTAVDLLDATVRAAIASGGQAGSFALKLVLRLNFVGITRTFIAISVDLHGGWERSDDRRTRIALMNQRLQLLEARAFYKVGDAWKAADDATTAVQVTGEAIAAAAADFRSIWAGVLEDSTEVERAVERIRSRNPALPRGLAEDLIWSVD